MATEAEVFRTWADTGACRSGGAFSVARTASYSMSAEFAKDGTTFNMVFARVYFDDGGECRPLPGATLLRDWAEWH